MGYPLTIICSALSISRSSYYKQNGHKEKARGPILDEALAEKIRAILDREETFGYRRVWAHLRFKERILVNIKKVHRIMKLKGWQCRLWNRPSHVPKATRVSRSTIDQPDRLWCLDSTKVFCGSYGWASLIALLDAGSREIVGYRFSLRGRAIEAMDALEQALIRAYGGLKAPEGLRLRSDNASIFLARDFIKLTRQLSLGQEFIPRYSPEYNGSIERFFRTLKQECVWLHRFESFEQAERIIPAWIEYYNQERLHSSLGYMTPREWRKQFYLPLAA